MPKDKQLHGVFYLLESQQETDGTFKVSNLKVVSKETINKGAGRVQQPLGLVPCPQASKHACHYPQAKSMKGRSSHPNVERDTSNKHLDFILLPSLNFLAVLSIDQTQQEATRQGSTMRQSM